jgi:ribosomal protein L16 Arg81 hydroxylase
MADAEALPDLGRMLAGVGVDHFFQTYWQKRTLATTLTQGDFERILAEIGPLDIRRFCGLAREGARAWITNEFVAHSVIPADTSNAEKLFGIGATLYFINVPLPRLTDSLANYLGAPRDKVVASLFLTPAGGGAAPHFDKNENFTIQLTGAKEWLVDSAPAVTAPPDGHVLGQTVSPSIAPLLPVRRQPGPPVHLKPGSLLYVPRGAVHATASGTVSWSLNLSYSPSMWLDLLLVGLRRQLSASPRWRGTVTGINPGGDAAAAAGGNILPQLAEELRALLDDPASLEQLARQFLAHPDG